MTGVGQAKIGFVLSHEQFPAAELIEYGVAAEEAGFDHVCVPDNVMYPESVSGPYPYSEDGRRVWDAETPCIDPWVAIPAMAARASLVRPSM